MKDLFSSVLLVFILLLSGLNAEDVSHVSVTRHSMTLEGKVLHYRAKTGTLMMHNDEGKPIAELFYVAYHKEQNIKDPARPITFCFGGGPGNATAWLHMGGIGPKKVNLPQDGRTPVPPYTYSDNPYSLLDITDLVFVDALSTGYSNVAQGIEAKSYYNSKEDTKLLAAFIRVYLTQNGLWDVPKYLLGQGFGGFRICDLAYYLHDENFIFLNGLILLSSIINYQAIYDPEEGNDLPYALALPSLAAAWSYYSGKSNPLEGLKQVESFAENSYSQSLFHGNSLEKDKAKKTAQEIASLTGINEEYILKGNLKIGTLAFSNELLSTKQKSLSLYDSRNESMVSNEMTDPTCPSEPYEHLMGAFYAAIHTYLSQDLQYTSDKQYVLHAKVCPWSFGHNKNQFPNIYDKLKYELNKNTQLKLFSGAGFYDLVSPYYAVHYCLSHLGLEPVVQKRVTEKAYPAGHILTLDPSTQKQLKSDLIQFYNSRSNE